MRYFAAVSLLTVAALPAQAQLLTHKDLSLAIANEIAQAARQAGIPAETVSDVSEGVRRALEGQGPAPHVLVCGGLHFAGEVLAMCPDTWPT